MLRKLSFILILAILLSACGASAPEENAAVELPGTATCTMDTAEGEPAESERSEVEIPESAAAAMPESDAEYFYFTKYTNTVTDDDDQALLYENRCMPTFISGDPQRSEWVSGILGNIERDFNTDSTNLYDYARDYVQDNGTEFFYSYSNYQQLGIARHDEAVVSLIALSSLYSGGSHPNSVQVAYNLDIANQRVLKLEDIILEQSAPALAKLVREAVDDKFAVIDGEIGLFEDYGETIDNSMAYGVMTPYWYLNNQGLVIFYNQYELGPYAAGIIKVELPYEALDGVLSEDYYPVSRTGDSGDLMLKGEWEGRHRIPITLDDEAGVLMVGVDGTIYQVQLSEVIWLEDTPIAQDLRFSALRLGQNEVLEIYGGYTDENRSFVIEFMDGRGENHLYHIHDGELTENP